VRFQVLTAASMKFKVFWDILPCSQTDVNICLTKRQNIPEDSELCAFKVYKPNSVGFEIINSVIQRGFQN
jgi:hypothetical protein